MRALFDIDSLFFKSVYKVITYTEIKGFLLAGWNKEEIQNEIIDSSLARLDNFIIKICTEIESTGLEITQIDYFITTCTKSFRKEISKDYKAKRVRNKYVSLLRKKFIETTTTDEVHQSDTHEADDLIACAIQDLNETEYIIISIDKDVKNLEGFHFDYYQHPKEQTMRGLGYTSKIDHYKFLAYQMLCGDSGDGIKGCKGVGDKGAKKIIDGLYGYPLLKSVVKTYLDKGQTKEDIRLNYRLLKLGM